MNIAHLVERTARLHPGKVAFRDHARTLSYAEFDAETNRVAHGLARFGIAKGDRVALIVDNCVEFPVCSFGVTKCGAVVVPLLANSSISEMTRWLEVAQAKAIFASASALPHVIEACAGLSYRPQVITVGQMGDTSSITLDALIDGSPDHHFDVDLVPTDLFTIRFTGGTTGVSKGVASSHRNYVSLYTNLLLNLPIDATDVALHIHPLSHAAGHLMFGYIAAGATQVIQPAFQLDPSVFLQTIQKHAVTSVFIVPTVLESILACPALADTDTRSLRSIIYGAAPMPLQRLMAGRAAFGDVFVQIYGASEAPMIATTLTLGDHAFSEADPPARLRSAGREVLNVEVRVVDDAGRPCPPGTTGEVTIRGDHTTVGYWRNDELTAQRIKDGWVHTGDMAYFDDDGYLYIVDRKDDMIITGGFNVWPAEIEALLYGHPDIEEVVVFGVSDDRWGEAVTAAVLPRAGTALEESNIIAFLTQRVSKYKVPKRVFIRSTPLPKSAVGKLLRRQAREECLGSSSTS